MEFLNQPLHYYQNESGYIQLLKDLLQYGDIKKNRNGDTLSLFGNTYRFNISNNTFPLLTTKYTSFKNICSELLWFLKGQTDSKILYKEGVKIWNENSTREFLDNLGLHDYPEGECGPIYSWQWRRFNADYPIGISQDNGKDQILYLVDEINKGSRRAVLSGWNPCQLDQMCLPPCHILYIFYTDSDNNISCHMTMRSNDTFLGLPYNIASTALFTYILGKITNKTPKEIVITVCDAHLYVEHIKSAEKQIENDILEFPKISIKKEFNAESDNVSEWIESLCLSDFQIDNYQSATAIKAKMIA